MKPRKCRGLCKPAKIKRPLPGSVDLGKYRCESATRLATSPLLLRPDAFENPAFPLYRPDDGHARPSVRF